MNDIVTILRDISNERNIDADLAEACRDGAKEIASLRLTDAEREAIKEASEFYIGTRTGVALRGLLERL